MAPGQRNILLLLQEVYNAITLYWKRSDTLPKWGVVVQPT